MLDNLILGKWKNRNFAQSVWFGLSIRNGWISFFLFSNQTGCCVWVQVCPGPNKNLFGSTNKVLSGSSVLVQIVLYNMRKQHHNENLVFLFSNPKYMFDIFSLTSLPTVLGYELVLLFSTPKYTFDIFS